MFLPCINKSDDDDEKDDSLSGLYHTMIAARTCSVGESLCGISRVAI